MQLHHIGWVVRSLEEARPTFEYLLDLPYEGHEAFPTVSVAFYSGGSCRVELVEPTAAEDPTAVFLAERGEGIHHLAFQVNDVQRALSSAKSRGLALLDATPRRGARNTLIGFVDPHRQDGILIEYVQQMTAS